MRINPAPTYSQTKRKPLGVDRISKWVYYTRMVKSILHIRKLISAFMAVILLATVAPVEAEATSEEEQEEFRETIIKASELLQKAIDSSKEAAVKDLKMTISDKGYDYQLTMLSFDNQIDPYKQADYNELILAYATAKAHSDSKDNMYNLPFYKLEVSEEEIEQYIPIKIQSYKEQEDGSFIPDGTILIDEPTEVVTVQKNTLEGTFKKTGTRMVRPQFKKISYGDVTLEGLDAESIFDYFGLSNDKDIHREYEKKLAQAKLLISGTGLAQSYNINVPSVVDLTEEVKVLIEEVYNAEDISQNRKTLIQVAKALVGKVPYEWGGKASKEGYDTSWWTIKDNGQQKGLDCSGFVQWAFRTAGMESWRNLRSTGDILKNTDTIPKEALMAGDLGLLNNGQSINHVGIYLGDGYWIHCSSGKGTVTIEKTDMFTIFKAMPDEYEELPELVEEEIDYEPVLVHTDPEGVEGEYTDEEIYLLAQLVNHEAHTEGLNGWIAVAEVVKNRISSEQFPSTINEVVYEKGQFSKNYEIADITPTEEEITVVKEVLAGQLKVLNNEDVLFFRNSGGDKSNWGSYRWYKEINHHEFYLGNKT